MWKNVLGATTLVFALCANPAFGAVVGSIPSAGVAACDDGNLATVDVFDFAGSCDITFVPVDDGNPDTTDQVSAVTGIVTHTDVNTGAVTTEPGLDLLAQQRRDTIPVLGNQTSALNSALNIDYGFDSSGLQLFLDLNPTVPDFTFSVLVNSFEAGADFVLTSSDKTISAAMLATVGIDAEGVYRGHFLAIDTDVGNAAIFGNFDLTITAPVPIPAAFPLLAAALGGLGLIRWRKRRSAA